MNETFPWWTDEDDDTLSPAWLHIMAEVEEVFAVMGTDTPGWDDPHEQLPGDQSSPDEWYSRVTAPERYRILWTRAQAWEEVIMRHGWARRTEVAADQLVWATDRPSTDWPVTVLEPVQPGGGPLILIRTGSPVGQRSPGIVVGTGTPVALPFDIIPDCGCDACDYGSSYLIEELDQEIIPVLDGSCSAGVKPGRRRGETWYSTPFTSGGSVTHDRFEQRGWSEVTTAAGPWFPDWTPMPMVEIP
jgi:hypothetical protein